MTYDRKPIVEDDKTESRERALDQILTLLRHPGVDVTESENLLSAFIRQTAYDAWDQGHSAGIDDLNMDVDLIDTTHNPYAEKEEA